MPSIVHVTVPTQAFLGYEEAAHFCGVSVTHLRDSDCARCAMGSRVVFFVGDLLRYLLDRRQPELDKDSVIEIRIEPPAKVRAA